MQKSKFEEGSYRTSFRRSSSLRKALCTVQVTEQSHVRDVRATHRLIPSDFYELQFALPLGMMKFPVLHVWVIHATRCRARHWTEKFQVGPVIHVVLAETVSRLSGSYMPSKLLHRRCVSFSIGDILQSSHPPSSPVGSGTMSVQIIRSRRTKRRARRTLNVRIV